MKDDGVTDVLGSILLVGITVGMMVGLSLLVLNFPAPHPQPASDLALAIGPGSGGWGDGDEVLQVRHLGGPSVGSIRLFVELDGSSSQFEPADQGFADGTFTIGETWIQTLTIPDGSTIKALLVDLDRGALVSRADLVASDGGVTVPPLPTSSTDNMPLVTMFTGSSADLGNLQADDGAVATLTESSGSGSPITARLAPTTVPTAVSVGTASNVLLSDDQDARMNSATDLLGAAGFVMPNHQSIQSLRIGIEAAKNAGSSDTARVWYSVNDVPGATDMTRTFNTGADQTFTVDVTSDRTWTKALIESMQVRVQRLSSAQELRVDQLFVEVTYVPPATQALQARVDFTNVQPIAGTYTVQLEYRVTVDTYRVEVYDWNTASFTARGATLTATTDTMWTYTLTGAEVDVANKAVRIRFVDLAPATGPGTLSLDYARVVST